MRTMKAPGIATETKLPLTDTTEYLHMPEETLTFEAAIFQNIQE
jgi:hypothetical protein